MRQLAQHIKLLWRQQLSFRVAASYLLSLGLLVILLPVLPLAYQPNDLDLDHTFAAPFSGAASHWLGTDALGRDVLVNILYGARAAFAISLPVMLLATLLGLAIGMGAGYFGNTGLKTSRAGSLISLVALLALFYYGVYLPLTLASLNLASHIWQSILALLLLLALLYVVVLPLLKKWRFAGSQTSIPLDYLTLRFTEAFTSIPQLLLVLTLASFLRPSVLLLCLILVFTIWTSTARLARAETLRIKQLPYFEAAKSIGAPHGQLLFRHTLPNMLGPIVVTFTFGVASLLVLESTLSFLGIGVPSTFVSWGRIIAGIRANTTAWWLVAFPGAILAVTIWAMQTISFHLLNQFEARKQL